MAKFKKVFDKTEEKIKDNGLIDFEKSSVNKTQYKNSSQYRTNRIQTYLTDSEYKAFGEILKPMEKPAVRIRKLIIDEIKRCQKEKG